MFDRFALLKQQSLAHLDKMSHYSEERGYRVITKDLNLFKEALEQTRYNIAIIGNMKRGKSTLINALLGRADDNISPIAAPVCTAAIVQYVDLKVKHEAEHTSASNGDLERAFVYFSGKEPKCIPFEDIRLYITEEHNPNNQKCVRKVVVFGQFPLLNESVTLVDTPGRGAIQEYHETLVEEFLPLADAIILPIAADLPIERSEKEFLSSLRNQQKDRIFFVLTKRDAIRDDDLPEVECWVSKQIADAGLVCQRLYQVAARRLFDAKCEGLAPEPLSQVREDCGVASLERDLEDFILRTSSKNAVLYSRLKLVLDGIQALCCNEGRRIDTALAEFDGDIASLEERLQGLEASKSTLHSGRDKALKKFIKNWDREVEKFRLGVLHKSDRLADQITLSLDKSGFLTAVKNSFCVSEVVDRKVKEELSTKIFELEERLADVGRALNEELDHDLSVYVRARPGANVLGPVAAMSGALTVAAPAAVGALQASAALNAASAAWTAWALQGSVATEAAANLGAFAKAWAWFVGTGTGGWLVPSTPAAANAAAAAKGVLFTGAITTTVSGIAVTGMALITVIIAKHIATWGMESLKEHRIPDLTKTVLEAATNEIDKKLAAMRDAIRRDYEDNIDDMVRSYEEGLADVRDAIEKNDPTLKAKWQAEKQMISQYLNENRTLSSELQALLPLTS